MIRLSVTELDSYLYWLESEDMEFDELLARLRGQQSETTQMLAGRAFHKVFEEAGTGEIGVIQSEGFEFHFEIDEELSLPPVRELKGEVVLQTPYGPVTLVGKVDSLDGLVVHDYKLTERFEAERYTDSYQWRAYLSMFGAHTFIYDVFQCRYDTRKPGRIIVCDYHRLPVHAYPAMTDDVRRTVSGLAEIVAKYVPEKITAEAA